VDYEEEKVYAERDHVHAIEDGGIASGQGFESFLSTVIKYVRV
jgi:hypothetical protein